MRTTLDIDDPVLRELKQLQTKEGKSLGRLVSDLLARALKEDSAPPPPLRLRSGSQSRWAHASISPTRKPCIGPWTADRP